MKILQRQRSFARNAARWRDFLAGAGILARNRNPQARGSGIDERSNALAEKAVVVAVPVEPAVAAAAPEKACFGVAFRIELDDFKAAAGAVGDEGNVVLLGHGVIDSDVILVLDVLDCGGVGVVGRFRLERRQGDAAAGHHGWAHGLKNVAADGANIELAFEHVGGAIGVDDLLAGEKLGDGNLECLREGLEQGNIWQTAAGFPFGDGFVADAEFFGELRLGEMLLFAQRADGAAGDVVVHEDFSPFTNRIPASASRRNLRCVEWGDTWPIFCTVLHCDFECGLI